jgi:hypothetical protein
LIICDSVSKIQASFVLKYDKCTIQMQI